MPVEQTFIFLNMEDRIFSQDHQDTENPAYRLGGDGCQGSSGAAKPEYNNTYQVQHDIQNGGNRQKNKRCAAVTDSPENSRGKVI